MASPAAPGAVLTARAASLLPPGFDAGGPVADPRVLEDDDADEMDLFLLQTDDEIQRRNDATATPRGDIGSASPPEMRAHIKQEEVDSPFQAARTPSASSSGRKRKSPDSKRSPQTPLLSSGSKTAALSYGHGKDENLPFHLKRKRISDSSSRANAARSQPRALATDRQVAAARSGTYPADDAGDQVDPESEHANPDEPYYQREDAAAASPDPDDDEDRPLGRLVPGSKSPGRAPPPGSPTLETGGPSTSASDMDESEEEGAGATKPPSVPYDEPMVEEDWGEYGDDLKDEQEETGEDPMKLTWADLVSGSHQEVWDDSELVDTWSQAEAEYAILQERRRKHRELLQLKAKVVQTRVKAKRQAQKETQSSSMPESNQAAEPQPLPDAQAAIESRREPPNALPAPPAQQAQQAEESKPSPKQPPSARISLPPVPSSHPGTGAGALGLTHDEIMQNLAYSSFYFGYYRALADVSSQGGNESSPAPPAPTPTNGAPAPQPSSSNLPALSQPATRSGQPMSYPYAMGHNMAYPSPMPYMPMAPYPQAMWPQFMPPMGQQ